MEFWAPLLLSLAGVLVGAFISAIFPYVTARLDAKARLDETSLRYRQEVRQATRSERKALYDNILTELSRCYIPEDQGGGFSPLGEVKAERFLAELATLAPHSVFDVASAVLNEAKREIGGQQYSDLEDVIRKDLDLA